MRVFKVVDGSYGFLGSAVATGEAKVEYIPTVPVSAPEQLAKRGYHLTAFRELEHAKQFIEDANVVLGTKGTLQVWLAEGPKAHGGLPPRLRLDKLHHGVISPATETGFPEGTVMVKSLTLIRQLN